MYRLFHSFLTASLAVCACVAAIAAPPVAIAARAQATNAAARTLDHADPETLEAMRAALLVEQDPEWRERFQREIRRQERKSKEKARKRKLKRRN